MKLSDGRTIAFLVLLAAVVCPAGGVAFAQDAPRGKEMPPFDRPSEPRFLPEQRSVSPGKAFALSLLLPGLGHRYVHGGDWDGWASIFAVADASVWAGLLGTEWRRDQIVGSYRSLATSRADALIEDKDRRFFLNLASFRSSDDFLETQLRNRNWSEVDYVAERSFQWEWETEADFQRFRALRNDSESLRRRSSFLIAILAGNRLISGVSALLAARRIDAEPSEGAFGLALPPAGARAPLVRLSYRW